MRIEKYGGLDKSMDLGLCPKSKKKKIACKARRMWGVIRKEEKRMFLCGKELTASLLLRSQVR